MARVIQLSRDPGGEAWDGRWPLHGGATYAVFVRVNPEERPTAASVAQVWRAFTRARPDLPAVDGRPVLEVHRLFYDDPDPDERIVYVPPADGC